MATAAGKPVMAPKPGSSAPGNNASIRLEKGNQGIRRSTPDSEALTSSDDELDHRQGPTSTAAPLSKPVRRTSWLNEVPQNLPRRTSITTSGSLAPVGINTQSPENDQTGWGANTSPGMNGSISWGHGSSFPWATGIWTADGNRKEPPPRLTELSQSPTMPNMPGASLNTEEILSPTARSMTGGDSSIPFNIPLHPTPKTYRSQSYSVGQLDPETVKLMASKVPSNYNAASRGRTGNQYPGLQHRPSRPSMLEDLGHDPALLGRVREDEDDEEEEDNLDSNGSHSYAASQARAIDQLARENALLRQTAHLEGVRMRDRTMSSASANSNYSLSGGLHNLHRIRGGVPEEVDLAVADQDELGEIPPGYGNVRNSGRRRMSEHSVNLEKHLTPFGSVENRPLESLRRAHWQTSLGFGSIGELPQSRRHSFAEIPTRHGSISESQAHMGALNGRASLVDREDGYSNVIDGGLHTAAPDNRKYFHSAFCLNSSLPCIFYSGTLLTLRSVKLFASIIQRTFSLWPSPAWFNPISPEPASVYRHIQVSPRRCFLYPGRYRSSSEPRQSCDRRSRPRNGPWNYPARQHHLAGSKRAEREVRRRTLQMLDDVFSPGTKRRIQCSESQHGPSQRCWWDESYRCSWSS